MSNKWDTIRIIVNTFCSFILLAMGLYIGYKTTLASYTYTENIIESEAARLASNDVSNMNLIISDEMTINDIALTLYKGGVVSDKNYFILEAQLENATTDFISGEYTISSNMSSAEILHLLTTNISNDA